MNPPKYTATDYINFPIGTQKAYSCSEAEGVQPVSVLAPSHDAITRLLHRLKSNPDFLWQEAQSFVQQDRGVVILDDTMLDKFYAQPIELVARQWSGKHKRVVKGINRSEPVVVRWG